MRKARACSCVWIETYITSMTMICISADHLTCIFANGLYDRNMFRFRYVWSAEPRPHAFYPRVLHLIRLWIFIHNSHKWTNSFRENGDLNIMSMPYLIDTSRCDGTHGIYFVEYSSHWSRRWFRQKYTNGNIFRVTGHLCGEFTGPRWIPHTKASDAELWCLLWSAPK